MSQIPPKPVLNERRLKNYIQFKVEPTIFEPWLKFSKFGLRKPNINAYRESNAVSKRNKMNKQPKLLNFCLHSSYQLK